MFSFKEFKIAFFAFKPFEKIVLGAFLILLIGSLGGLAWIFDKKFSVVRPARKGVWTEGIIGTVKFINPLLAVSPADRDLASLVYSGLLKSDGRGGLKPDLAENYKMDEQGLIYTFYLRPNLKWQDGRELTAEDIVFTFEMAKHPGAKSYLREKFEGVEIEAPNKNTVRFSLKKPYALFLENLTLGILPAHIWSDFLPEEFSVARYNILPVGSGPYQSTKIQKDESDIIISYELKANNHYYAGKPHIPSLIFKIYSSEEKLLDGFAKDEIKAISAVAPESISNLKLNVEYFTIKTIRMARLFAVFFNQNKNPALADLSVRQALEKATDRSRIINEAMAGYAEAALSPLPKSVFGHQEPKEESKFSIEEAKKILEEAGFKKDKKTGVLQKKKDKKGREVVGFSFSLSVPNIKEFVLSAKILKENWEALGAKIELKIFEMGNFSQNILRTRDFESLVFGQAFGVKTDLYPFWHSSERLDPGLNVSMYANLKTDKMLEELRLATSSEEQFKRYADFQQEIEKDKPALFLYSPYFIYIIPKGLKGFESEFIVNSSERFANIHNWYLETERVWKGLQAGLFKN